MRYPGGKKKLSKQIVKALNGQMDEGVVQYREPFVGAGSIAFEFLKQCPQVKRVWVNDFDLPLAALWLSFLKYPDALKRLVLDLRPSVDAFFDFKAWLLKCDLVVGDESCVEAGFRKLAIHQMSYSGLGLKSGGPLGGFDQESDYKIDCRWSPKHICKKIDEIHRFLVERDVLVSSTDFEEVLRPGSRSLVYLDPPYYEKGGDLYHHAFSEDDHRRLAACLKSTRHSWVLSYDDCPQVRALYEDWSQVDEVKDVNYSITAVGKKDGVKTSRKKTELIITPRRKR